MRTRGHKVVVVAIGTVVAVLAVAAAVRLLMAAWSPAAGGSDATVGWSAAIASALVIVGVGWTLLLHAPRYRRDSVGEKLLECPACGKSVAPRWRMCPYCGHEMAADPGELGSPTHA